MKPNAATWQRHKHKRLAAILTCLCVSGPKSDAFLSFSRLEWTNWNYSLLKQDRKLGLKRERKNFPVSLRFCYVFQFERQRQYPRLLLFLLGSTPLNFFNFQYFNPVTLLPYTLFL